MTKQWLCSRGIKGRCPIKESLESLRLFLENVRSLHPDTLVLAAPGISRCLLPDSVDVGPYTVPRERKQVSQIHGETRQRCRERTAQEWLSGYECGHRANGSKGAASDRYIFPARNIGCYFVLHQPEADSGLVCSMFERYICATCPRGSGMEPSIELRE